MAKLKVHEIDTFRVPNTKKCFVATCTCGVSALAATREGAAKKADRKHGGK